MPYPDNKGALAILPPPRNYAEINQWIETYYSKAIPVEYLNEVWKTFLELTPPSRLAGLRPAPETIEAAKQTQAKLLSATIHGDLRTAYSLTNYQLGLSFGPRGYIDYFGIDMWRAFFNSLPRELQIKVVADLARIPIPAPLEASHASIKASSVKPSLTSSSITTSQRSRPTALAFPPVPQDFLDIVLLEYKNN